MLKNPLRLHSSGSAWRAPGKAGMHFSNRARRYAERKNAVGNFVGTLDRKPLQTVAEWQALQTLVLAREINAVGIK